MKIKSILSRTIRDRRLHSLWSFLNRLSFYGMNYEVASGYADYSGELHVIRSLKKYLSTKPIDILINNTQGPKGADVMNVSIEDYQKSFDLLTQCFSKVNGCLKRRRKGREEKEIEILI